MQIFVKLSHHLARFEAFAIVGQTLHPACHHAQEVQILVDHIQHARAQHLDGDLAMVAAALLEHGKVDLCNRGAGHRLPLERDEDVIDLLLEGALNDADGHFAGKGWHAVL